MDHAYNGIAEEFFAFTFTDTEDLDVRVPENTPSHGPLETRYVS